MRLQKTIGFLGAGNLTTALVEGLLASGISAPRELWITNRQNRERLDQLTQRLGVQTADHVAEVARHSQILVVACKPKDVPDLLRDLRGHVRPGHVLLTLAAGVTTASLQNHLPAGVQIVRAMPNTSCLVRQSATGLAAGPGVEPQALADCRTIMAAVGQVVEVPEDRLDAVTGLSGSGPAYVYFVVEAMVAAGVQVGLAPDVARALVLQTLTGAAQMLVETGTDPAVLRQQVTSPGGTTAAGLQVLAERGFDQALVAAVVRATERARELGAGLSAQSAAGD